MSSTAGDGSDSAAGSKQGDAAEERDAADMVKQLESHPTYDMLSLACCLPEVKVVFEGLPAEDDTNARHVARNILKQYSASDYSRHLRSVVMGEFDPRRREINFHTDGGSFGVVQQGTGNIIELSVDETSILQQGTENALNINLNLAWPMPKGYQSDGLPSARKTAVTDFQNLVSRMRDTSQPVSSANHPMSRESSVDPSPSVSDDEGFDIFPSTLLSLPSGGSGLNDAVSRLLGLDAGGPVQLNHVTDVGNGQMRVQLTTPPPSRNSTSSLVIMKLRGPMEEFEQRKESLRHSIASLTGTVPEQVSFISAKRCGSVATLMALPTQACGRLLELAVTMPSLLRSIGVYDVCPVAQPINIDVAEGMDVLMLQEILLGACCKAICDSLLDSQHLTEDQHENLSTMASFSHLQDRLLSLGVPQETYTSSKQEALSTVLQFITEHRRRRGDGEDYGTMSRCLLELVTSRFKSLGSRRRGLSMIPMAQSAIQDFATSGSDNATKGLCRAISTTTSQARSKNAPHGVSFLMLASPTYRPWSRETRDIIRVEVNRKGGSDEASLASLIARLCSLESRAVSVRRIPADSQQPGDSVERFVVILPRLHQQHLLAQCQLASSNVSKALLEYGILSFQYLEGPIITLRQRESWLRRRLSSRLGSRSSAVAEVSTAISARREEMSSYKFPSLSIAARCRIADVKLNDIKKINIAVAGPRGAGKSALINTLASIVEQTPLNPCDIGQGDPSQPHTKCFSRAWGMPGVSLFDCPGWTGESKNDTEKKTEMDLFLHGMLERRLSENEDVTTLDEERLKEIVEYRKAAQPIHSQMHGVIIVLDGRSLPLDSYDTGSPALAITKEKLSKPYLRLRGMDPIVVVTNITTPVTKDLHNSVVYFTNAMNGDRFFVDNSAPKGRFSDAVQVELLEALSAAVHSSEQFILRAKQEEKQRLSTQGLTDATPVEHVLSKAVGKYRFNRNKIVSVSDLLESKGITNQASLLERWDIAEKLIGPGVFCDKLARELGVGQRMQVVS